MQKFLTCMATQSLTATVCHALSLILPRFHVYISELTEKTTSKHYGTSAAPLLSSVPSIYTTPHNIHFHKHLGTWIPHSPKSSMTSFSFQITNKPCSCELLRYLNPNINNASLLNAFYSFSQRPYICIHVFALAYMASLCYICQILCVYGQQNRTLVGLHCLLHGMPSIAFLLNKREQSVALVQQHFGDSVIKKATNNSYFYVSIPS